MLLACTQFTQWIMEESCSFFFLWCFSSPSEFIDWCSWWQRPFLQRGIGRSSGHHLAEWSTCFVFCSQQKKKEEENERPNVGRSHDPPNIPPAILLAAELVIGSSGLQRGQGTAMHSYEPCQWGQAYWVSSWHQMSVFVAPQKLFCIFSSCFVLISVWTSFIQASLFSSPIAFPPLSLLNLLDL